MPARTMRDRREEEGLQSKLKLWSISRGSKGMSRVSKSQWENVSQR